ncbi:MAG: four helix bundle protein [Gemmatimonadaceae bacterium]|nr:four helix bundle protein [Gemmatimonadaceae bacterium]
MTSPQPSGGSPRITSHRDLIVWQKSMQLAAAAYQLARRLPPDERFGLRVQMQRAAVSVVANIAEGHGRLGKGDYVRGLSIARGSLMELECLMELGATVGYFDLDAVHPALATADEIGRMLWVLIRKLGARGILPRTSL